MLNVPTDLAYQSASRMLSSTSTIAIYYYYSAQKLILILLFHAGWKAELKWGICAHTIFVCSLHCFNAIGWVPGGKSGA